MKRSIITMFKCAVCGKITAGRMPKNHSRHQGDTSGRFPRRHKGKDGKPCAGNIEEAEWVTIP
jgi:hypothetical protein